VQRDADGHGELSESTAGAIGMRTSTCAAASAADKPSPSVPTSSATGSLA
jgi:hypothetical protein